MELPFGPPLLVVNARAGRHTQQAAANLVALFADRGVRATVQAAPSSHALGNVCADAVAQQHGFVIVVGGDGTVRDAVNGFFKADLERPATDLPVLGIVGSGTGSDFTRTYGLDRDPETLIHHFMSETTTLVDVGVIRAQTTDGAPTTCCFLNVAQVGFGARVTATANRLPRRLGATRYRAAIPFAMGAFRHQPMRVIMDNAEVTEPLLNVVIANGQFFGAGLHVAPQALPHDGVFDVQCWSVLPRDLATAHQQLKRGQHLGRDDVRQWRSSHVDIHGPKPMPVEADGDSVGVTPATIRIKPHGIRLKI